ncbi:DHS-like NAD/FAD-binding domain-containing protein [Syncephalis fuscata]|nr:DHS-like NAD/FAD-binding domain-containing protein [Syncephalis fuscata]
MGELRKACIKAQPTRTHHFLAHLKSEGKLLRCYTQNIDGLERVVDEAASPTVKKESTLNDLPTIASNSDSNSTMENAPINTKSDNTTMNTLNDPSITTTTSNTRRANEALSHVIQLHGTLERVRCTRCSCPACEDLSAARASANKRPLAIGSLRPDIVLYNEVHPDGSHIAQSIERDLRRRPDLLLVMGTSLKVYGCKRLVRDAAKAVRATNGTTILINRTPVIGKEWEGVFDWWIEGDSDDWVEGIQESLRHVEQERQQRRIRRLNSMSATISKEANNNGNNNNNNNNGKHSTISTTGQTQLTQLHSVVKPRSKLSDKSSQFQKQNEINVVMSAKSSSKDTNTSQHSEALRDNLPSIPSIEHDKKILLSDKVDKRQTAHSIVNKRTITKKQMSLDINSTRSTISVDVEDDIDVVHRLESRRQALLYPSASLNDVEPLPSHSRVTRRTRAREEADRLAAIQASLLDVAERTDILYTQSPSTSFIATTAVPATTGTNSTCTVATTPPATPVKPKPTRLTHTKSPILDYSHNSNTSNAGHGLCCHLTYNKPMQPSSSPSSSPLRQKHLTHCLRSIKSSMARPSGLFTKSSSPSSSSSRDMISTSHDNELSMRRVN